MRIKKVACFFLLAMIVLVYLLPAAVVLAQEETIDLEPTYRKLEATSPGASFEFEVTLKYWGEGARDFELVTTAPQDWTVYVKPQYGEQRIRNIRLEPYGTGDKVKVIASPSGAGIPEAGEYEVILEASAQGIEGSIALSAVITDSYSLEMGPVEQRLNTKATAGRDNIYSIILGNSGSGTLEDIKLSSVKPSGWKIEFTPEEIESLASGVVQTVDVNIIPDEDTIAGDYEITLAANTGQVRENIKLRVTVETPTIWGWVGIGIILVVIAAVIAVFMRFSRR